VKSTQIGLAFVGLFMTGTTVVLAKDSQTDAATAAPPLYQAVIDCRSIGDAGLRLACFDQTVRAMAAASDKKDLVIIDRATIRATKQGLFGIAMPKIKIFGGNDNEDVNQIESTIVAASAAKDGMSLFALADGSRWKQTDGRFTYPKAGQAIVVKRAALGSFMANVAGQPGVRVVRLLDK